MKMLATSAETIPLWVGKDGEEPPPMCGAIPPEPNYAAQASSHNILRNIIKYWIKFVKNFFFCSPVTWPPRW